MTNTIIRHVPGKDEAKKVALERLEIIRRGIESGDVLAYVGIVVHAKEMPIGVVGCFDEDYERLPLTYLKMNEAIKSVYANFQQCAVADLSQKVDDLKRAKDDPNAH